MRLQRFTTTPVRLFAATLAVALLVLVVGAQGAAAQSGVTWEQGNFCVEDYQPGANCTANDVSIAKMSPSITEACTAIGDTAKVKFLLDVQSNSSDRYDIGIFIATDGGDAKTGNSCYHDFLQPAATSGWNLTGGFGPFRKTDGDTCGDIEQTDGINKYYLQQEITVACVDNNNDGIVDPISTCTSWDNNAGGVCSTVKNAFPSNDAKCKCQSYAADPAIILYRGLDFGDLPDTYKTLLASDGPRHAIQDTNNDGTPDTIGLVPAVWLGASVDLEANGIPSSSAMGDDLNNLDDENGVSMTGTPWTSGSAQLTVTVSASTGNCTGCEVWIWIDWNNDGTFDQIVSQAVLTGSNVISFAPSGYQTNLPIAIRVRLYQPSYLGGQHDPTGLVVNGEVEDYRFSPLAVNISGFTAAAAPEGVTLAWETVSETSNAGFNIYRSTSDAGPWAKVNATLIPAAVPGSSQGHAYTWTDASAEAGSTYFYQLEDVALSGATTVHAPVSVTLVGPNAVGLAGFGAAAATATPALAGLAGIALAALAGVGLRRRR